MSRRVPSPIVWCPSQCSVSFYVTMALLLSHVYTPLFPFIKGVNLNTALHDKNIQFAAFGRAFFLNFLQLFVVCFKFLKVRRCAGSLWYFFMCQCSAAKTFHGIFSLGCTISPHSRRATTYLYAAVIYQLFNLYDRHNNLLQAETGERRSI